MKLAVNFSNPLVHQIKAKEIKVDLIKCPDWEGMLAEARPYGPSPSTFPSKPAWDAP